MELRRVQYLFSLFLTLAKLANGNCENMTYRMKTALGYSCLSVAVRYAKASNCRMRWWIVITVCECFYMAQDLMPCSLILNNPGIQHIITTNFPPADGLAEMRSSILRAISRRPLASRLWSPLAGAYSNRRPQISAMSTHRPLYEHIDEVERLNYYRPGGYHPIQIGVRFRDRYRTVHKLGYGSYSTIWLARDEQMAKSVAIKVGTADHGSKEVDVQSQISASAVKRREFGSELIPLVLDRFDIHGPNGTHPCLVTTPARCSLADAAQAADYSPFQLHVARSLSAQFAMAVAYIHELGYVHGGQCLALPLATLLQTRLDL